MPLLSGLAVGTALALAAVGVASAEKPTVVKVEGSPLAINGGFSPKALPKRGKPAPLLFHLSAEVRSASGSVTPALHEVSLELDRHITADAKGMAICPAGNVESPPPEERCGPALIGRGTMEVLVGFPEGAPFSVVSKLFAFNAGIKHGTPTILIYTYLPSPVSAAMVTTVGVTKIDRGRYGTRWLLAFPKIAGGYGSIVGLSLEIGRRFRYLGEEKSYLLGRCPDGHLDGRATSVFTDGFAQTDSIVRSCTPTT
jgi:hypothetical protein